MHHPAKYWITVTVALLFGVWLRTDGLHAMTGMLQYDEAYYAVNAISLIEHPRLQLFFPENTGREGLWMYLLAPAISVWGAKPFTLRFVAVIVSILTLAAIYRLGREVYGQSGGLWAMLALTGLYLVEHNSHVAFRVLLFPLVGCLALVFLLRAHRENRPDFWRTAGIFAGLLAYTYTAAHGWLALIGLLCLWWAWSDRTRRRGAWTVILIAAILAVPVYLAMLTTPSPDGGLSRTLVTSWDDLHINLRNWLFAWRGYSDVNLNHNIPNLSILDDIQALLAVIGFFGSFFLARKKWYVALFVALFVLALLPSIITLRTPQYIRAFGMIAPLALCIGGGALTVQQAVQKLNVSLFTFLLPLVLLLAAALNTLALWHTWLRDYRLVLFIDDRINGAMAFIRENTPSDAPIYFPYSGDTPETTIRHHPVAEFHAYDMRRKLVFFPFPDRDGECFLTPRRTMIFLDLPNIVNQMAQRSAAYGAVKVLYHQPENEYNVLQFTPAEDLMADWQNGAVMGGLLQVQAVTPVPDVAQPGETVTFRLGMRVLNPVNMPYRFFVHVQGNPTPYEGGPLFATGDAPLCQAALQPGRTVNETLVQIFSVILPPDMPSGEYHIALGLYDAATGERLSLATPDGENRFYEALEFRISADQDMARHVSTR